MTPVIGICGASGSGKTTLLTGVIAALKASGLKVGAIKHHGHAGPVIEPAAAQHKDSARLAAAGAARVALAHAHGVSVDAPGLAKAGPRALAARLMSGLDLVLVEGFKGAGIPKIEVVAPGAQPLLPSGGQLLALARRGGAGSEAGLPVLDADDPGAVAGFILENLELAAPAPEPVGLFIDGQELPVNAFVARMLSGALRGFVSALKGGGQAGKIEVRLG
ncbi:MAG: molybdopterin-guanine dinucleotide biosynthesis protein B [Desulfarculus sp.]|nr:MAG: molybdopterin-guanine dinucleotide biosynthesis protein B [Desulfarculus sp.]